jgi:mRNA interferase MazF
VIAAPYVPERGDFVTLDFDPQAGHEQAGRRPALVLTPALYNGPSGLAIMCAITSQTKGYPYEVQILDGLRIHGVVLSDHVRGVDWTARQASFVDKAPLGVLSAVLSQLGSLLGIVYPPAAR